MKRFFRENEQGQSMLEFALFIPLLLLLLMGMFDTGRVLFTYLHLNMMSQEAARMGSLGATDTEIEQWVVNEYKIGDATPLQIAITPTDSTRTSGDYFEVELTYPVNFFTPVLSQLVSSPYQVTTGTTIRVE